MLWLVGAGPGDPDLLTRRAAELLGEASLVMADRSLWPLVRALAPAAELHPPVDVASWPIERDLVRLYHGDGLGASAADRARLDSSGRSFDLLPGPADDVVTLARSALGSRAAVLQPLLGVRIVVTRPRRQQSSLSTPLRRWGAHVVAMPTIAIDAPQDGGAALAAAVGQVGAYDWVVLTSANGANALLDAVPDARLLAGVRLAAIGPATAAVLAAGHLLADLVPTSFVAEGLLAAFPAPLPGRVGRVLLVRAAVARDVLPNGLRAAGWVVDEVPAYRSVAAVVPDDVLAAASMADAVLFSSPSTVAQFLAHMGTNGRWPDGPQRPTLFAIGPVTATAMRAHGLRVDVVAERYDVTGLLDAVLAWARR